MNYRPQCSYRHITGMTRYGNRYIFSLQIINRVPTCTDPHKSRTAKFGRQFPVRNPIKFRHARVGDRDSIQHNAIFAIAKP